MSRYPGAVQSRLSDIIERARGQAPADLVIKHVGILDLTDGEFNTRFIGNLHLKGKAETVNIYGVIGYADGRE